MSEIFAFKRITINKIFTEKLTRSELIVLIFMSRFMKKESFCYLRNKKVAECFNVSYDNIRKAKTSLKKKGLIKADGYKVSFVEEGKSFVPFPSVFIDFLSSNSFTAAQIKALIFIVKTDYEKSINKYGNKFYLSKAKFNRDTGSSQAVILKILRLLVRNNMLIEHSEKFEKHISWYSNLHIQNKALIKHAWEENFKKIQTSDKSKGSENSRKRGQKLSELLGSKNCRYKGQKYSANRGQICSQIKETEGKKDNPKQIDEKNDDVLPKDNKDECNAILQKLMKEIKGKADIPM